MSTFEKDPMGSHVLWKTTIHDILFDPRLYQGMTGCSFEITTEFKDLLVKYDCFENYRSLITECSSIMDLQSFRIPAAMFAEMKLRDFFNN
jgi:hypothetical protein